MDNSPRRVFLFQDTASPGTTLYNPHFTNVRLKVE